MAKYTNPFTYFVATQKKKALCANPAATKSKCITDQNRPKRNEQNKQG
jgi:hypothetical protein